MDDLWHILCGHLDIRPGAELTPVSSDGTGNGPVVLRPREMMDRAFLVLHAAGQPESSSSCLLRMASVTPETAEKARQEVLDLSSDSLPVAGTTRPATEYMAKGRAPEVLPPLYYCRQKSVWISAVCPDCSGKPGDLEEGSPGRCEICGSAYPATGEPVASTVSSPMEALWTGVQNSLEPGAKPGRDAGDGDCIPLPYCLECERKRTCFAPSGSRVEPRGALDALIPLMGTPWVGTLVARFDIPLQAWLKLAEDPVTDRSAAGGGHKGRLVPAEFQERAQAESLLLRLEALRQIVTGIRGIHAGLQHPHLDIRPESIWVGRREQHSLAPSMWSPDVQLVDLAPGRGISGKYARPADLPPELIPTKSANGEESIPGLLIPRGETVEEEGHVGVKFLFLPQGECEAPPGENEPVSVAMVQDETESRPFDGRVEVNLKDVYRLVIYPGDIPAENLGEELKGLGSQAVLRKAAAGGAELIDPDLFAAGTIWLSMLRWDTQHLERAAKLRETMMQALETEDALRGEHSVAERICLTAARKSDDLFRLQYASAGSGGSASMGARLMGNCLWLGLRMCGALPEVYNGAAVDVMDLVLREIDMLQEEARYLMLGRSSGPEEILGVIRSFQADLLNS